MGLKGLGFRGPIVGLKGLGFREEWILKVFPSMGLGSKGFRA